MQRIYTKAIKVIVWLGESDELIGQAMDELLRISQRTDSIDGRVANDRVLFSSGLPIQSSPTWVGIHDLLCRPWFSRLWVFSEAVLPKTVESMCGDKLLSYEALIKFVESILAAHAAFLVFREGEEVAADISGLRMLSNISLCRGWRASNRVFGFLSLLLMVQWLSLREAVDKVYGLLGLAPEPFRQQLKVDYSKSAAPAYLEVAISDLETTASLNALHFASSRAPLEGLPSWCPNFSGHQATFPLGTSYSAGFEYGKLTNSRPVVKVHRDNNALQAPGFRIDQVINVVCPGWVRIIDLSNDRNAAESLAWRGAGLKSSRATYPQEHPDDVPETHQRCLIANKSERKKDLNDAYTLARVLLSDAALKLSQPDMSLTDAQHILAQNYIREVNMACTKRSFFSTRNGRIGLGPSHLKSRDTVCVLCNGSTPFIIRPKEANLEHHELIGESYVEGLMDGEVFGMKDMVRETITLV